MNKGEEGKLLQGIYRLSDSLVSLSEKIEKKPGHVPELIVITLYVIGHVLMSLVHEPWFDEALAWLISRDSSIYDIMFEATHYEGHPALWHLVLAPFAKSGAPYELSLSFVSLLFSGTAVALFVWKAPFKRIFRITIPFTYFIFYQYSVVSRPYCMMMLAFVLMAITYKSRNEHPGRFVCSMLFLCATSAYGIVIAGGVTIAWLIEMFIGDTGEFGQEGENGRNWTAGQNCEDRYSLNDRTTMHDEAGCDIDEKRYNSDKRYNSEDIKNIENRQSKRESNSRFHSFMQKLLQNGKIIWLGILLAYALFVIWRILPADDAYAVVNSAEAENPLIVRGLYLVFGVFSDLFITNSFSSSAVLKNTELNVLELCPAVIIGAIILFCLFKCLKSRKKLCTFLIPYVLIIVFSSCVYFSRHHLGMILLLIMFGLWSAFGEDSDCRKNEFVNSDNVLKNITKRICPLLLMIMLLISFYWTVASCAYDVTSDYAYGRSAVNFMKENDMQNVKVLCEYSDSSDTKNEDVQDIFFSAYLVGMEPYMYDCIMLNDNEGSDTEFAYIHRVKDFAEKKEKISDMIKQGLPDIILGNPNLKEIYGDSCDASDYVCVYKKRAGCIWKGIQDSSVMTISVRNYLCNEKGLTPVK